MKSIVQEKWFVASVVVVVLVGGIIFASMRASAASSDAQTIQVRWLISHQPTSVFVRAEKILADDLSKETGGRMTVTILNPQDVGYTGNGDVPPPQVHQLMDSGAIQLATVPVADLAGDDPQMLAFTLPFLFQNYASTEKVIDGPVGAQMLSRIGEHTDAQALAFTFSGGFLVIPTLDKKIVTAADFKGLRLATSQGPIEDATLRALGAIPVDTSLDQLQTVLNEGKVDGAVSTYTRMSSWLTPDVHYVYEDDGALFLTSLLASDSFYNSLSDSDKAALQTAVHDAAQAERADSIALAASNRTTLENDGVTVTTPSPDALAELKSLTSPVYNQFSSIFNPDFVTSIKSAQQ